MRHAGDEVADADDDAFAAESLSRPLFMVRLVLC